MSTALLSRPSPKKTIPRLENGDHLSRDEFERRYHAMPPDFRAELLEGVVYVMSSPVRVDQHGQPQFELGIWLGNYWLATPGTTGADNSTVRLDMSNEPQPDFVLIVDQASGGASWITSDGYLEGSPELAIEISASSISIDRNLKFDVYRRNGIREYIIWRTEDEELDWFHLVGDGFVSLEADADGVLRSRVFPGLWLNRPALLARDMHAVMATLQLGLASAEHQTFVASLKRTDTNQPSATKADS